MPKGARFAIAHQAADQSEDQSLLNIEAELPNDLKAILEDGTVVPGGWRPYTALFAGFAGKA